MAAYTNASLVAHYSHPPLEAFCSPEIFHVARRVEGALCELRLARDCPKISLAPKRKP
jgi:hypothetical protein